MVGCEASLAAYLDNRRHASRDQAYVLVAAGQNGKKVFVIVQAASYLAEQCLHPSGFCALLVLFPRRVRGCYCFDNCLQPGGTIFNPSFMSFGEAFLEGLVSFCKFVGWRGKQDLFATPTMIGGLAVSCRNGNPV